MNPLKGPLLVSTPGLAPAPKNLGLPRRRASGDAILIKKIICTRCPQGCEIHVRLNDTEIESIEGNLCKLGKDYSKTEIIAPKRVVTSTVKVFNGVYPLVPVWTSEPIPKDKIFDLMNELRKIQLTAPVKINQIILQNIFGLGIDVIASRPADVIPG